MVSNKLTNRRRTARKPPVCRSGPAVDSILFPAGAPQLKRTPLEKKLPGIADPVVPRSGRCPPPPPPPPACVCTLDPSNPVIAIHSQVTINVNACRGLPPGQHDLHFTWETEDGYFSGPPTGLDCQNAEGTYIPETPGTWWIKVTARWDSDAIVCEATGTVTVEGYPG